MDGWCLLGPERREHGGGGGRVLPGGLQDAEVLPAEGQEGRAGEREERGEETRRRGGGEAGQLHCLHLHARAGPSEGLQGTTGHAFSLYVNIDTLFVFFRCETCFIVKNAVGCGSWNKSRTVSLACTMYTTGFILIYDYREEYFTTEVVN